MSNQKFYVLKEDGEYFPMAFMTLADEAGEIRKDLYKIKKGQTIVLVELKELEKIKLEHE